jgi:hypothetical protein
MANEVTKMKTTALSKESADKFQQMANVGFEEVSTDDLAIPFVRILQSTSKQVKKSEGAYVDGATEGMIYNNVLNKVYNGDDGIEVVPCYYYRRYVEWVPREDGGGYVQAFLPGDNIINTTQKNDQGKDVLAESGNYLENTAHFFCIYIDPELGAQKALIPMSSSQLKKSRKWLSNTQTFRGTSKDGKQYFLPMFSQVYTLTSIPESNAKGSWMGWEITWKRTLDLSKPEDNSIFDEATGFAMSVKQGEVEVKTEQKEEPKPLPKNGIASDDVPF